MLNFPQPCPEPQRTRTLKPHIGHPATSGPGKAGDAQGKAKQAKQCKVVRKAARSKNQLKEKEAEEKQSDRRTDGRTDGHAEVQICIISSYSSERMMGLELRIRKEIGMGWYGKQE